MQILSEQCQRMFYDGKVRVKALVEVVSAGVIAEGICMDAKESTQHTKK